MQALTLMTVAALALGAAAFAYDSATAQTPAACPTHEVSLYFEKGKNELNDFSKAVAERVAAEARACGVRELVAETHVSGDRLHAISDTFASMGVKVIPAGPSLIMSANASDTIADRAAVVRISLTRNIG